MKGNDVWIITCISITDLVILKNANSEALTEELQFNHITKIRSFSCGKIGGTEMRKLVISIFLC